jgi:hypothetical protein
MAATAVQIKSISQILKPKSNKFAVGRFTLALSRKMAKFFASAPIFQASLRYHRIIDSDKFRADFCTIAGFWKMTRSRAGDRVLMGSALNAVPLLQFMQVFACCNR